MKIAIVLYDGDCNFCNKWVCFTSSKLQKNEISFIPFNSIKGLEKIEKFQIKNQNSVAYIRDDIIFFKSRAVLKICKQLQFPYNLPYFLTILPTFLLDFCYDFIAKRRLTFNSKKQCCNG
jgi:predicted DCC family thiol-disulfide oxidoreductase YuxK